MSRISTIFVELCATSPGIELWPENRTSCESRRASRRSGRGGQPQVHSQQEPRHAEPIRTHPGQTAAPSPDGCDHQRGSDPDYHGQEQVDDVCAVVGRKAGDVDGLGIEPAPAPQSDKQHVADCGGDEARDQDRDQRRAQPDAALEHNSPPTIGPPNSAEMAETSRAGEDRALLRRPSGERPDRHPRDRPERDQRALGSEDGAERQRSERGQRDPGA